jgi:hypothetical protein
LERIAVLKLCGWETGNAHSAETRRQIESPGASKDAIAQLIDEKAPEIEA